MNKGFSYSPLDIADAIKIQAKTKNVSAKDMLQNIGLGPNAIAHMRQGRMPLTENLAKIADYLDCSVDYLLGRTGDMQVQNELELKPEEYPVIVKYRALAKLGQIAPVDTLLDELYDKRNTPTAYSDERIETILQNSNEMRQVMDDLSTMSSDKLIDVIRFVQFQKSLAAAADE